MTSWYVAGYTLELFVFVISGHRAAGGVGRRLEIASFDHRLKRRSSSAAFNGSQHRYYRWPMITPWQHQHFKWKVHQKCEMENDKHVIRCCWVVFVETYKANVAESGVSLSSSHNLLGLQAGVTQGAQITF